MVPKHGQLPFAELLAGHSSFGHMLQEIKHPVQVQLKLSSHGAWHTSKIDSLRLFAAWLYFNEDLQGEEHECQQCSNLHLLMDCYEAALLLSRCQVEQIDSGDETGEAQHFEFQEWLYFEVLRFKDCVIKAMVSHCQRREGVPSPEEIYRLYSIAALGDPLRGLIADVHIWNNKCSILDVDNVEFHREINARLINSIAGVRENMGHVQKLVQPYKDTMDSERFYYRYSTEEQILSRLAELVTPWPLQIDASTYIRKSISPRKSTDLEEQEQFQWLIWSMYLHESFPLQMGRAIPHDCRSNTAPIVKSTSSGCLSGIRGVDKS